MKHNKQVRLWIPVLTIIGIFIYTPYLAEATIVAAVQTNAEHDMTPFYWTVAIVGGLIAITLSYVSWRKYRGEEKKHSNNDPNS